MNGVMDAAVGQGWTSMASAPFVEEALKAAILLRFYSGRRDEFDGVGRRRDLRRDGRPRVRLRRERRLLRPGASSTAARRGWP